MAAVVVVSAPVIAAGESLSSLIDISAPATGITRIICPSDWSLPQEYGTTAPLSFCWSPDGGTYYNLFDLVSGKEVLIPVVPNALIVLPRDIWRTGFMKFRSGRASAPVIQQAQRIFRCVLE